MSNEANSTVDKLLNELLVTIKDVKNLTVDQAPEIAQQMIAVKVYTKKQNAMQHALVALIGVGLMFTSYHLMQVTGDPESSRCGNEGTHIIGFLLGLAGLIVAPIGVFCAWDSLIDVKRIQIAPKAFLLRELRDLMDGNGEE